MAASASWEGVVRAVDFDRYLSSLFASARLRSDLNVLYAFNHEVAKTAETVHQPIAGQIRLQWWRDRIARLYRNAAIDHRLTKALGEVIASHRLPRALFDALIEAREHDLEQAPFATLASFEAYADGTSGNVMRLAARILGAGDALDQPAREFGIAYAIVGLCRSLPYHAAGRRLMLPADRIAVLGMSPEEVFAGNAGERLRPLLQDFSGRARTHLQAGAQVPVARSALPALLPAAVVRLYVKTLTKPHFDVYRDSTEIAPLRRQFAMLAAMIRGHV